MAKGKLAVGLDIGSGSIKLCHLKAAKRGNYQLQAFAMVQLAIIIGSLLLGVRHPDRIRLPLVMSAVTLAGLFTLFGLMTISRTLETGRRNPDNPLSFGQGFCQAYETYLHLHPETVVSFEHAWNLFHALTERLELVLADCSHCGNIYVQDALALDRGRCPSCRLRRRCETPANQLEAGPA